MTTCKINLNSIEDVKEFVGLTNASKFDIDIISGRYVVDAKSIMGIFSLDITKPLELSIHADGDNAADFIDDIKKFVVE
ncbi:MAG: HPr family phosphocarrier protein [Oscillospiraceae bacterium]